MNSIRRCALRALNSRVPASRTISTRTSFGVRSSNSQLLSLFQTQNAFSKRSFTNDSDATQAPEADTGSKSSSAPASADQDDSSTIRSAIESATESASTYAHDAAESLSSSYESTKESVSDFAHAAGSAAGFSAPRRFGGRDSRGEDRLRPTPEPSSSIYVGNLIFDVAEEELKALFAPYGEITSVKLATDERGMSKGFGFIDFTTVEAARNAIEAKHEKIFEGRDLIVNYRATTKRDPRAAASPSKTLFVGNLPFEMSDADLNRLFKDIKNVVDIRVNVDRRTGQPRGFAHAEFSDIASAQKAIELLAGKEVYGRVLRLDFSAGPERSSFAGGRGGFGGDRGGDRPQRGGFGGDRGGRPQRGGYGGDRGDRPQRGGYGGDRRGGNDY